MKKNAYIISGLVLLALLAASCSAKTEQVSSEPVLKATGIMTASWTKTDLKALPTIEAEYTNKDGEISKFSGVAFSELLKSAGADSFSILKLVAADGYSADVTAEELAGCPSCIIAFQDEGGLKSVMPGFSGKLQVRDLIEIEIN